MKNKEIIGIDVSEDVLDCYLLSRDYYFTIENNPTGFSKLIETCCGQLDCKPGQMYLCFEDTGRYSRLLAVFLQEQSILFSMVNALDVKQSKGLVRGLIRQLDEEVALVEEEIDRIFASMDSWQMNYQLIQTIKGIGPVLTKYFMIYTENFTRFSSMKKFACYAGIAPFEYSSGSSVKGRTRVHRMANKHLKSLLNMSAISVIRIKGEYKQYYERRTEAGKNKMSTLNVIRNKLVSRVFAVVKRQTPYVDLAIFA